MKITKGRSILKLLYYVAIYLISLTHSFPALTCYDTEVGNAQSENNKLPACQSVVNNQDLNSFQWKICAKKLKKKAVGAKILHDINSIDVKGIGDLPMEVILCVLIVKFRLAVVCAMSSVISSLSVLPANVRHEVFALLWPDLLEDDANVLFQSVSKLKLPNVKTDRKFHVFTPPIGHCFHCKSALVRYNKPVKVKVHGLSGTSDGVKVSLKCNRCNTFYGYLRFGSLQQGWNLYPNSREMVEATDVCFVDRILLQLQISLA